MNQMPDTQTVHTALRRLHAHKIFARSPLMYAFLAYVVDETLRGRESRISAYSVAVDALGKPIDFDPQLNPSVRVLAKRLRESLERYYEEEENYQIRIVMKPGSYVPSFHTGIRANSTTTNQQPRLPWTSPVLRYQ